MLRLARYLLIGLTLSLGYAFGSLASILEPLEIENTFQQVPKVATPQVLAKKAPMSAIEKVLEAPVPEVIEPDSEPAPEAKVMTQVGALEVMQEVGRYLVDKYALDGELKLTPLRRWKDLILEGEYYEIDVLNSVGGELRSGMSVSFRILSEHGEVGKWNLPFRCELFKDVYYTAKRFRKGVELIEGSVKEKLVDVLKLHNKPVDTEVNLSDYEVTRTVGAEKPLYWKDIALKPHIRKGKLVDVVAEEGGMRIATKGLAMESGLKQEFIKVRNMESRRDIQAQILDENTVKVYF